MIFYLDAFKNFNYFDERTARTPFWSFVSYNILFSTIAFWIDLIFKLQIGDTFYGYTYLTYAVVAFIPGLAISIRRLHDIGKNGWNILWAFVPFLGSIYIIYLLTMPSETDENVYGKNPDSEKEISSFINNDIINNKMLIAIFTWIIISKSFWIILKYLNIDLFRTQYYFAYNGIVTLIWAIFPFMISRLFKNQNLKIVATILSILYFLYSLFEFLDYVLSQSNHFQF